MWLQNNKNWTLCTSHNSGEHTLNSKLVVQLLGGQDAQMHWWTQAEGLRLLRNRHAGCWAGKEIQFPISGLPNNPKSSKKSCHWINFDLCVTLRYWNQLKRTRPLSAESYRKISKICIQSNAPMPEPRALSEQADLREAGRASICCIQHHCSRAMNSFCILLSVVFAHVCNTCCAALFGVHS